MANKVDLQWIEPGAVLKVRAVDVQITPKDPFQLILEFQKLPLPKINPKRSFSLGGITADNGGSLPLLRKKAASFRKVSEEERINLLLDLARANLVYPYQEKLEALKQNNSDLEKWVREYLCEGGKYPEILSKYVSKGYGVCRHFAALFAVLAQAAELEVIVAGCCEGQLVNVIRPDSGKPLFKSVPLGPINAAHAWNEIRLKNGQWISVDPTANLNGLDNVQKDIFEQAHYVHNIHRYLLIDVEGLGAGFRHWLPIEFRPAQPKTKTVLEILNYKTVWPKRKVHKVTAAKSIPQEYRGNLEFTIKAAQTTPYLGIKILRVEDANEYTE